MDIDLKKSYLNYDLVNQKKQNFNELINKKRSRPHSPTKDYVNDHSKN